MAALTRLILDPAAMRKIVSICCAVLLAVVSCGKPDQSIDYSGEATLYRVGDDTYVKPINNAALARSVGNKPKWSFTGHFYKGESDPETFILELTWPYTKPMEKGEIIIPETALFANPYFLGTLGNSQSVEQGAIRYMGESNGNTLIQFEDLVFKTTRSDESGITDKYYIRGTAKAQLYSFP